MGEHALSDKLASNDVCRTDRFFHSIIRMQHRVQNWQVPHSFHSGAPSAGVCEHALTDKMIGSGACGNSKFSLPYHSGIKNSTEESVLFFFLSFLPLFFHTA